MLILERPWTRQPQGAVEVDWSNPLSGKLAFLAPLSPASGGRDLVQGQIATRTGGNTSLTNKYGQFSDFGTGKYSDFAKKPLGVTPTTPTTIAWTQEARSGSSYSTVLHLNVGTPGSTPIFIIFLSSSVSSYYFTAGPQVGANAHSWSSAVGAVQDNVRNAYVLVTTGGLNSTTASEWTLYQNGIEITRGTSTTLASTTGDAFRVGAYLTGGDPFEGIIGDLHIWGRALSSAEARLWSQNVNVLYVPRRRYLPPAAAAATVPTLSDLQAASITTTTVQGTYDYAF